VLEITPDDLDAKVGLAYLEVYRNGNPAAGRNILAGPDSRGIAALARWDLAMLERDYAGAEKILGDIPDGKFSYEQKCAKTFFQGQTALAHGDVASAQRYFAAAVPVMEGWMRDDPDDPERHALLGLVYAYMQRKEGAIREGRRAVEMEPESQDPFHGADTAAYLALIYALVGDQEQAITLIEHLLSVPGLASAPPGPETMTLANLRLRWEWDSLRSNPRFQKILGAPEPKTILAKAPIKFERVRLSGNE
jgi:tetratricopeptide (TPR) repeat protein